LFAGSEFRTTTPVYFTEHANAKEYTNTIMMFTNYLLVVLGTLATCLVSTTTALSNKAAAPDVLHLERKVEELFRQVHRLPVVLSKRQNNKNNKHHQIQIRTTFDGDCMVSVAEATTTDYLPDDFKPFLEQFNHAFPQVNPMAQKVIPLEGNRLQQAVKSILKFPFPLQNRIMVHWKYLRLDRSPQEHMLLFSEQGNQHLLERYITPQERHDYVLARTFLCVYWIRPLTCPQTGTVQGSCIRYAFSGDTGGTIPAWVQKQVGPKTALDSVQGLLKYVQKQQSPSPKHTAR
jgi:hypothetical protein